MRIAVIDLGTNTCNLLIAELNTSGFKLLYQGKELVKLGDGKIKANEISEEATRRTVHALKAHKKKMNAAAVDQTFLIATSAVRSAYNKEAFIEAITKMCDCRVDVISGEREAELIFKGVLLAFEGISQPSVILDIGGGSNELILAENDTIVWKESRPTGMSRIINSFPLSDPISVEQIQQLKNYFLAEHQAAIQNCLKHKVETLLGCSGAFDTIADVIDQVNPGELQRAKKAISIQQFKMVYEKLIQSTRSEREQLKGMDHVRIDLIVPAVILIDSLIGAMGVRQIIQTDFALREGVLSECLGTGYRGAV